MKNFNLLLATTAILSAGLATGVMAVGEPVSAPLTASISIFTPFTINSVTGGVLIFPQISTKNPAGSGKVQVTVSPDGTIDESQTNAQLLNGKAVEISPIIISGGTLGGGLSSYNSKTAAYRAVLDDENASAEDKAAAQASINAIGEEGSQGYEWSSVYYIELSQETIPMYIGGNTAKPCGEVTHITPKWRYTADDGGTLEIRFGGTFELGDINESNIGCTGSISVTFFDEGAI